MRSEGWALLAVAGLWLCGCGPHPQKDPAPAALAAQAVRIQKVEAGQFPAFEEVVGTVRAKTRASIEAKVSGRIERLAVVAGQTVKAGDVIAELDRGEIQARLDQAQARLDQARKENDRFKKLLAEQAVTQQEYDAAESRFRVAEGAVAEAKTMLGYARVSAPFEGVITRKLAEVGDLATPGRGLVEIEDPRALRLEADVSEALLDRVQSGQKMTVRVGSLPEPLEGMVSEIAPAADPVSRTFRVKLDLPPTAGLRAGQFGRVALPLGASVSLQVPSRAVQVRGQMEMVFVVGEGKAHLRLVKTGKRRADQVELVSGVEAGEEVVVEGAERLVDGQAVVISAAGGVK